MINRRQMLSGAGALIAAGAAASRAFAADLPFKLFDTHVHFFTDDLERYPMSGTGNAQISGPEAQKRAVANPMTYEKVMAWWDAHGVEGGCGVQYRTVYSTDNHYLIDCAARGGGRISPVVVLDAASADTPRMMRDLARDHGVSGVRLTGFPIDGEFPWLDSDAALNSWAVANDLGLTMVLMYLPPDLAPEGAAKFLRRVGALADRFPHANVELDHLGWPRPIGPPSHGLTAELLALRTRRNVYFKFTTVSIEQLRKAGQDPAAFVRHAVDAFGADRMMWGSDVGNSAGAYGDLVRMAVDATAKLTPAERRMMLRNTGMKAFVGGGRGRAARAA